MLVAYDVLEVHATRLKLKSYLGIYSFTKLSLLRFFYNTQKGTRYKNNA